jgi:hypothetical protein
MLACKVQKGHSPIATNWLEEQGRNNMKILQLGVLAAALAVTTLQSRADQTNLVENIQIQLLALKQGDTVSNRNQLFTGVDTVRVNTRHVIQALGTSIGMTFSNTSRLVFITPLNGELAQVEVRDGDVHTDVTGFFILEQIGDSVTSSILNTRTGRSAQVKYNIQRFALTDMDGFGSLGTHFDVRGFGTDASTDPLRRGLGNTFQIDVAGNGDHNGEVLVIQGSILFHAPSLEVVPDGEQPPS